MRGWLLFIASLAIALAIAWLGYQPGYSIFVIVD